jgi:predicted Zn-dependent peptidase
VPNNAVLVLAGDVDEKKALALAEKYFGRVSRNAEPPPVTAQEPPPAGLKRIVVKKDVAPVLDILVKTPELGEKDVYGLDIIEGVLNGPSGRLHKTLVKEKKLCTSVSAGNYVSKYYGMFMVHAELMQGVSHEKVESVIFDELDRLKKERISERELEKVKNRVTASEINGLRSNERLADRLAFYEIIRSWKLVNTFADEVRKVSREDVMALAARYLTPEKSTIGWLIQEKEGGVQ